MSHFYLTLPSNSSAKYFPDNTLSHFVTKLHSDIALEGDWEVGLSEIVFPKNWLNVGEGEYVKVKCTDCKQLSPPDNSGEKYYFTFRIDIRPGRYETVQILVNEIRRGIEEKLALPLKPHEHVVDRYVAESAWPLVSYSTITGRTYVTLEQNFILDFTEGIARILGFTKYQRPLKNNLDHRTSFKSDVVSDAEKGLHIMYVYCDLLEYIPVGDTKAPLLRIIEARGTHGVTSQRCYDRPRYVPLQKKTFGTVEIDIRDDYGGSIPFESGKLIVTLHFRRSKFNYFM